VETLDKSVETDNVSSRNQLNRNQNQAGRKGKSTCPACGRKFWPDASRSRFCDHACYSRSLSVPIQDRFWSKVKISTADACWLWQAATIRGYGQIGSGGHPKRPLYAHRVAWELTHGAIPDDLNVLHRCDVPLCVNPAHLFLGTQHDNLADMVAKGRDRWTRAGRRLKHADALGQVGHEQGQVSEQFSEAGVR
jgi:hypothetical protein